MPDPYRLEAVTPHRFAALPNILTISRILSIPLIVIGILNLGKADAGHFGQAWFVLGLFILAGLTDFLDGFLARRWAVVSDFGRMIDPIADKLLVAGCLIALAIVHDGVWYVLLPALVIVGRDILVSGAREHAALKSRAMPPTNLAKWKTACEMLAILALILAQAGVIWSTLDNAMLFDLSLKIGIALVWLAAILSAYTGSLYFRAALKD